MTASTAHGGGSIAAAWSHRNFRIFFSGSMASNIGTWMQNFALGALADQLTGRSWFIGLVLFAQLGPTLLISPISGVFADRLDRRWLMCGAALVQTGTSFGLAFVARSTDPSRIALVALVFIIGVAGALHAPTAQAVLPELVDRRDLGGAIALNSAQMNVSRVVGPLIAGLAIGLRHSDIIFMINGATYLFVVAAVLLTSFDRRPNRGQTSRPVQQLREGLAVVRADRVMTRVLVTVALFSFFSLVFIYQLPPFARKVLHGDSRTYTVVFSSFGVGAALGAIAVGTILIRRSLPKLCRGGLVVFGVALATLALQHHQWPAAAAAFVTGGSYFVVVTSLSTILQHRVPDAFRGRVMSLWMMAWAGLVPLGGLVAGPIIDLIGLRTVFLAGAFVALLLIPYADLHSPDHDDTEVLDAPIEPVLE